MVPFGIFVDIELGVDHGDLYIGLFICFNNDIYLSLSTNLND